VPSAATGQAKALAADAIKTSDKINSELLRILFSDLHQTAFAAYFP